jgi:hypothetical protein
MLGSKPILGDPDRHPTPQGASSVKSQEELRKEANKTSVDLLFSDAEMAFTMLDLALNSKIAAVRERRIKDAARAYSFIRERIPKLSLSPSENVALNEKLAQLEARLSNTATA